MRGRTGCDLVVQKVVQASGFPRGVSIPVFINLFQFFSQGLSSNFSGLHMFSISEWILALFLSIC